MGKYKKYTTKFKKVFIVLFMLMTFLLLYFGFSGILKKYNKFGYFVTGPNTAYPHFISNRGLVRLNNGNILILGTHYQNNSNGHLTYIPTELYNVTSNEIETFNLNMDKNLVFKPEGILLNDNKLLLTSVGNKSNPGYPSVTFNRNSKFKYLEFGFTDAPDAIPYNNMAIIDLKKNKVEKIIPKKLEHKYHTITKSGISPQVITGYKAVNLFENFLEIFDLKTGTSKIISFDYDYIIDTLVNTSNGILLLGINADTLKPIIIRFDEKTETLENLGVRNSYRVPIVQDLLNAKLLIIGTKAINVSRYSYGEIYDLKNKKTLKTIPLLRDDFSSETEPPFSLFELNDRYIMILGGCVGYYPITGPRYIQNTEIIDIQNNVVKKGPKAPFSNAATIKLDNGDIFLIVGNKTAIFKVNKTLKGEK